MRFELGNLVAQQQATLLQAPERQFVARALLADLIDQIVQVGMLHPHFDQQSLRRMQAIGGNRGVAHNLGSLYCRS